MRKQSEANSPPLMTLKKLTALFALPLVSACVGYGSGTHGSPLEMTFAQEEVLTEGAVSAADPRAQAAGEEILAMGGSATDAAIAVMLALTVVEPQSSGIGGGGFLIRGTADGDVISYDGRETAPAGATPEWFLNEDGSLPGFRESVESGLSVGVPGNIRMAALAHERHGRLAWADLFGPAIKLARDGFGMNQRMHNALARRPEFVGRTKAAQELYFDGEGKVLPAGSWIRNEAQAQAFEAIAKAGPDAFYTGELAAQIVSVTRADTPRDGAMTAQDLAGYKPKVRDAVCGNYRSYRICSMGPPSSGGVAVIQMLGQLERFDLTALGANNPLTWHLFLESQRLAYADREIYMADSDFVPVPVAGLIDPDYIAMRSQLIDPDARQEEVAPGTPDGVTVAWADGNEPEEHGTSHFSVADAAGNMASYTSTIESAFGSGLMAHGFFLNNELTDFSRTPEVNGKLVANRVEGGKRPRSSMSPTIVWAPDGKPFMVVGAAGGPTIPVSTTRAIIGAIDFGLSAEEALALPFVMSFRGATMVEEGTWLDEEIDLLGPLGYRQIIRREAPIKVNAILREDGVWVSARDPRIETLLEVP